MVIEIGLVGYVLTGLLFLILFELTTKRLSRKIAAAADEASLKIVERTGSVVSLKAAVAMTVVTTWLFWPAVLYGAVESKIKDRRASIEK